jgi:hypothetical protein
VATQSNTSTQRGGYNNASGNAQLTNLSPSQRLALLLDASPLNAIQRWLWLLSTGGT